MKKILIAFFLITFGLGMPDPSRGQSGEQIREMISRFRTDPRGPYKDIRWYCPDGTVLPPQERCPDTGGIQKARYKDEVVRLSETRHLFIGQILAGTSYEDFWDDKNLHSRLKQYQFEQYLKGIDNHWVWEKAQYYRGAVQAEDEEKWGIRFFRWLLLKPEVLNQNYFLIRQALKDIPHQGDNKLSRDIRALSKNISDAYPPFMNLRVKIHGQPDSTDIGKVREFLLKHNQSLTPELIESGKQLLTALEAHYLPVNEAYITSLIRRTNKNTEVYPNLRLLVDSYLQAGPASAKIQSCSNLLLALRGYAIRLTEPQARLDLCDLSIYLENQMLTQLPNWNPPDLGGLLEKIKALSQAAAASGFLEIWEWDTVKTQFINPYPGETTIEELNASFTTAKNIVQWGTLMIRANYQNEISLFSSCSDKIQTITDDWIRSSVLLQLGDAVSTLGEFINRSANHSGQLFDSGTNVSMRGLNPGFAKGELVVVDENDPVPDFSKDKIYVLHHPPSDMKPVAGIATSSEGNLVSHVQLLARNLGIPNAIISKEAFPLLKKHAGEEVFFAVSPGNLVVMKELGKLTVEEKMLFETRKRTEEKVHVPVDRIDLSSVNLINLREVSASSSGIICGPKAANLGELKQLFPDQVVNGLVIPFGVFKKHMDQPMPGSALSYWDFLLNGFRSADSARVAGSSEADIQQALLVQLDRLSTAIKKMPFLKNFNKELQVTFQQILGKKMGEIPVFLRSDTNMEDLKDFTGAGLNLTLFNVLEESKILQGIREVWASPYSERSFRWRQLYLDNPENVFPSILIIPAVNVDCSGVMITTPVGQTGRNGLTLAFSRGAGGAVEGQIAESYWVFGNGPTVMISPSREPLFTSLPLTGGTLRIPATFEKPILDINKLELLGKMAADIKARLKGNEESGADQNYDIELGFLNDKIWLFQIRPFVENKKALSSLYLSKLDPVRDDSKKISLSTRIL